jgi:hypothetical protein
MASFSEAPRQRGESTPQRSPLQVLAIIAVIAVVLLLVFGVVR